MSYTSSTPAISSTDTITTSELLNSSRPLFGRNHQYDPVAVESQGHATFRISSSVSTRKLTSFRWFISIQTPAAHDRNNATEITNAHVTDRGRFRNGTLYGSSAPLSVRCPTSRPLSASTRLRTPCSSRTP